LKPSLWLALMLLAGSACSAAASPVPEQLATHPVWLELLRYEKPLLGKARSAIHSTDFFLAADGRSDPLAELAATLKALAEPPGSDPDAHAACRFPARAQWLASQLPDRQWIDPPCPRLDDWTRNQSVDSVSVIFATGFLGNPASYYGHTLLKLNSPKDSGSGDLLDRSVNYGAILEGRIDPLSYVVKGIVGGYDGGFSDIEYYFHNHNYGETELRDLWEYQLDLPPEHARLIVNHAWEVLGQRYVYYFFRRNCAYRMAEVLQMADGVDVIPANRPWTIPQSLIQRFDAEGAHGARIASTRYYPSRQSRLYHHFGQLDQAERQALNEVVADPAQWDSASFGALPVRSQQAVADTALDYYQFALRTETDDPELLEARYRRALVKRYELPPGRVFGDTPAPPSPHLGRRPGWFQLAGTHTESLGAAAQVRIRAAYYDALDGGTGHVENAGLTMGDLTIRLAEDHLSVRRITLFAIESLDPGITRLPGDRGSAWNLGVGADSVRLDCRNCLAPRLHGDMGRAARVHPNLVLAGYAGGALQENRLGYGHGFARLSGRAIYRNGNWAARGLYEWRMPVAAQHSAYGVTELEVRRSLGRDSDLRVLLEHNGATQIGVGLGWYW
jgi:hypothetical protein